MKRQNSAGKERSVDRVTAIGNDRHAKISQAGSYDRAQISAAINSDLHISFLLEEAAPVAGLMRPVRLIAQFQRTLMITTRYKVHPQ
jgi:hypothetical protein